MKKKWFSIQSRLAPYIFLTPFILLFLIFTLFPLLKSLALSLYITNGPKSQEFVGFENFIFLFDEPTFHKAIWNTMIYAICSLGVQLPLSLGLALLLNSRFLKARNFFRFSFFSPHLVGQVFVAVLFAVIFMPKFGLLNRTLHAVIDTTIDTKWLGNPDLVMPALVMTSLWMYVGFNMIYFLAALQSVDRELYEVAQVDGAGPVAQFRHVTLPSIKSVTVFVGVLTTIGSFQLFELPYVMLGNTSGPDNAGLTVVMYLFQNGFISGDLGYASAIGWSLTVGVLLISLLQMRLTGTWNSKD